MSGAAVVLTEPERLSTLGVANLLMVPPWKVDHLVSAHGLPTEPTTAEVLAWFRSAPSTRSCRGCNRRVDPHARLAHRAEIASIAAELGKSRAVAHMFYKRRQQALVRIAEMKASPFGARNTVYFIRSELTGLVKIGFTTDLSTRFRQVECGTGGSCRLLRHVRGDIGMERELHGLFTHYRAMGEWFRHGGLLASFIQALPVPT